MGTTNVWFMAFDSTPKPLTKNYSMIYVFKTFLDKNIDLVGKIIGAKSVRENVVKLEDVKVKLKGSSGYVVMDSKFAGKKMRFFIYEHGSKALLKTLELQEQTNISE